MRPLVLFGPRVTSRPRAIALICAWILTGCCQAGSNGEAPTQVNAAPSASGPLLPVADPTSSGTATSPTASVEPSAVPVLAEPPSREIAGAAHILIAYKGAENAPKTVTRSKDDAKKRAEEALKELRKDESKFGELVKKYSDDPVSKGTEGRLGNFERNVMPATFSDACFSMKVDAISDVVETPRGFHIIKRTK